MYFNKTLRFGALLALLFSAACGGKTTLETDDPVEYNSFIENEVAKTGKAIMNFAGALAIPGIEAEKLLAQHEETVKKINASLEKVEGMASFKGDRSYRRAATDLIRFYEKSVRKDYGELVQIMIKPDRTDADIQRMEEIAANFSKIEKEKNDAYVLEQQKFAVSYDIKAGVPVPDKEDYRDLK